MTSRPGTDLLRRAVRSLRAAPARRRQRVRFERQFAEFAQLPGSDRFPLRWSDRLPRLGEDTPTTDFDYHYVYHPAWAARIIRKLDPRVHVDIGSSLFFVSVLSAFVRTEIYDYRPAEIRLDGLKTGSADLTALHFEDRSIDSLSCMHVVEHIGLGRYGDRLDPNGDLLAMSELQRVLSPGGNLLFVVPVGRPRLRFNGLRIYSLEQIIAGFPELDLAEFALIPERGPEAWIAGATAEQVAAEQYGCGCFWFQRPGLGMDD
jgi:SAM-dependent methyltransferase